MSKIRRRLTLRWYALQIEFCWHRILQCRKNMNRLYQQGVSFTSQKMVSCDSYASAMGLRAISLEKKYLQLTCLE